MKYLFQIHEKNLLDFNYLLVKFTKNLIAKLNLELKFVNKIYLKNLFDYAISINPSEFKSFDY